MSVEVLTKFLEELKAEMCPITDTFPASTQEQYLTIEGWLDKALICDKLSIFMSTATFRKTVKDVFNTVSFRSTSISNEVSAEEFHRIYQFGKHSKVQNWIGEVQEKLGKVITREKLFEYVLNSPKPSNDIFVWCNGLRPVRQYSAPYKPTKYF